MSSRVWEFDGKHNERPLHKMGDEDFGLNNRFETFTYLSSIRTYSTNNIGDENKKRWLRTGKCSFLPEEREWLNTLIDWGFEDSFRTLNPETNDKFSWFDYRSKGFNDNRGLRIDLILATKPLHASLHDAGIDYELRGIEKPSDHAPIWAEYKK